MQEFLKIFTYLVSSYNIELKQDTYNVYYDFLKDEKIEDLKLVFKNIISKYDTFPSIALIKRELVKIKNPILSLNADEEWLKVRECVRKFGSYKKQDALDNLNDFTAKIVEIVGYQRICMSENIAFERKDFIETFKAKQKNNEVIFVVDSNKEKLKDSELKELVNNSYKLMNENGRN